ncbi:MAG: hypothetical protein WKF88_09155 [Ferruginibacter sp.]
MSLYKDNEILGAQSSLMKVLRFLLPLALIAFTLAAIHVIDYFTFTNNHIELAKSNREEFKQLYLNHFPSGLQRFYSYVILSTLFFSGLFGFAGVIFILQKHIIYKTLGILSFMGAFLMLWWLM